MAVAAAALKSTGASLRLPSDSSTMFTSAARFHSSSPFIRRTQDSGPLTHKESLPVRSLLLGDIQRPGSEAAYRVGPLRCHGDSKSSRLSSCLVTHDDRNLPPYGFYPSSGDQIVLFLFGIPACATVPPGRRPLFILSPQETSGTPPFSTGRRRTCTSPPSTGS